MAMLAEPRRKQKVINLRAKNNAWSNDTNKFGQRMLEKMGWSSGKGLGAKENGIVEHVVAKYKNDEKGLGFEDRNDQWTKHEDDFNALLSNLSSGDKKDDKLHSGVSLEVKSKKSKARVHYHKFTRGKDLTRYSEKDLANIFGKKTLKGEQKVEDIPTEDVKTAEQIFTEKGSMEDYFKNKLAAFKSKAKMVFNNSEKDYDDADCAFQGFAGTNNETETEVPYPGFDLQSSTLSSEITSTNQENAASEDTPVVETTKKKKKKKSKHQDEELLVENQDECDDDKACVPEEEISQNKKSKKKKYKLLEEAEAATDVVKSKKKKRKNVECTDNMENTTENNDENESQPVMEDNHVPKKKKKRKCAENN